MLTKRLLVPFINNKILQQAEYCYISTSAISEPAFDMIMSKLSPKCPVDIVTGLDIPTDPKVLCKIYTKYTGRVTLRIHTKNFFHANTFIFDLPFRKRMAFISSGSFTLGGLKDNEELSYKIETDRDVEDIKSWFRTYFEYAQDLNEKIIDEYEIIYHAAKQREIASKEDKKQFSDLVLGSFNWDRINFTNQFFKQEDYLTFENAKAGLNTPLLHTQRVLVQNKLIEIHEALKSDLAKLKLFSDNESKPIISSLNPIDYYEHKVKSICLAYGRSENELKRYQCGALDLSTIQLRISLLEVGIYLMMGRSNSANEDRAYFQKEMKKIEYRKSIHDLLKLLGNTYWIEIAGERRQADSFESEESLWYFTSSDNPAYAFIIGKNYNPGASEISSDEICNTIKNEFNKLVPLYRVMRDNSPEK
jgi:HKD family nuclease